MLSLENLHCGSINCTCIFFIKNIFIWVCFLNFQFYLLLLTVSGIFWLDFGDALMVWYILFFTLSLYVSYWHHLESVIVVRGKLFQRSSPLKLLDQLEPNLVCIITRVSSFKIVSGDAVHQSTWFLGNNSITVNNIRNLTR